ncbi:hypothetical protein TSUD_361100 [Trifolium subterraneum]|uniref:Uncharacterized protein n=1 Tax=Trifolium subterraneum TaxID=3900 RepID=A0A2Z6NNE6_TRISU|nr:hypothetical protein TSUD_361100 [Trifolium subterraneum]
MQRSPPTPSPTTNTFEDVILAFGGGIEWALFRWSSLFHSRFLCSGAGDIVFMMTVNRDSALGLMSLVSGD